MTSDPSAAILPLLIPDVPRDKIALSPEGLDFADVFRRSYPYLAFLAVSSVRTTFRLVNTAQADDDEKAK